MTTKDKRTLVLFLPLLLVSLYAYMFAKELIVDNEENWAYLPGIAIGLLDYWVKRKEL